MNLPDPSGSSPAEKPPGIMRICDSLICLVSSVRDCSTCCDVRLRKTEMLASAPASLNIFAESYSEFVPGKQGMITLGLAPVMMWADFCLVSPLWLNVSSLVWATVALVG